SHKVTAWSFFFGVNGQLFWPFTFFYVALHPNRVFPRSKPAKLPHTSIRLYCPLIHSLKPDN
ncbi:MAG: hypothetical protein LBL94_02305, partial [Prevotellaceae bacterium]|nr:hypothetical protein [Prevotellaceae bacterium]